MARNRDGKVVSFGCNRHGQAGIFADTLSEGENVMTPTFIENIPDIEFIACGPIFSCLIATNGKLYMCGFGAHLYPRGEAAFSYEPRLIEDLPPAQKVACGQSHCLVLTRSGNVYCWGSGDTGQIGIGDITAINTPQLVLEDKEVSDVACGRYHSMALTRDGILYAWGCNENGQLGLAHDDEKVKFPVIVETIVGSVVGQISCGEQHTAVLTSAPWTRWSSDIRQYCNNYKQVELKLLKKKTTSGSNRKGQTQKGLKKEGLSIVQEQEEKDNRVNEENRQIEQEQINSIIKVSDYRKQHHAALKEKDNESKTATLPQPTERSLTIGGTQEEFDTGAVSGRRPQAVTKGGRLPAIATKGKTRTRKQKSAQLEEGESEMSRGVARVAFLKETAAAIKKMTAVMQDNEGSLGKKPMDDMIKEVFLERKEFDSLRHKRMQKQMALDRERKEHALMTQAMDISKDFFGKAAARKRDLQMQLDTELINIAEIEENRKNYEHILSYLLDEKFDRNDQLKKLRKRSTEANNLFRKVSDMRRIASEEKDKVESELLEFEQEIAGYQNFVKTQMGRFEGVLDIVRAQNDKHERTAKKRLAKGHVKVAERVQRLQEESKSSEEQSEKKRTELKQLGLKLRHFEDNYQKITAATGLTDPDAIVMKFNFKGEIKEQLQREIEDKQQMISDLKAKKAEQAKVLEAQKASFKEDRWRDVQQINETNRGKDHKYRKNIKAFEKVKTKLAFAQEGLDSLMYMVTDGLHTEVENGPAGGITEQGLWTKEKCEQQTAFLERLCERLATDCSTYIAAKKAEAKALADAKAAQAAEMEEKHSVSSEIVNATKLIKLKKEQDEKAKKKEEAAAAAAAAGKSE